MYVYIYIYIHIYGCRMTMGALGSCTKAGTQGQKGRGEGGAHVYGGNIHLWRPHAFIEVTCIQLSCLVF